MLGHVRLRNPRSNSVSMVNSEEMNAGLRPAFISEEFTIDTLLLRGFLSLTCQRTKATLLPHCSVAFVCADYFRLFLNVIHTYNYHNILGSRFSWCVQYLRDMSEWNGRYWHLSMNTCQVCYSRGQPDFPQIIISMTYHNKTFMIKVIIKWSIFSEGWWWDHSEMEE